MSWVLGSFVWYGVLNEMIDRHEDCYLVQKTFELGFCNKTVMTNFWILCFFTVLNRESFVETAGRDHHESYGTYTVTVITLWTS